MVKYGITRSNLEEQILSYDYNHFGDTGIQCVLTLKNGYTVTGESYCIDPDSFDENIGKSVARNNAVDKLWSILSYVEKQRWFEETQLNWSERVQLERKELLAKIEKLGLLIYAQDGTRATRPDYVSERQWLLLCEQYTFMEQYARVLAERLTLESESL